MIWLNDNDLTAGIKDPILTRLLDDNNVVKLEIDREATEEVQGYLRGRFNLQLIFSQVLDNRNAVLVRILRDVFLYHLHSRINPNQIPDIRLKRYDSAIENLKAIRDGKLDIGLPIEIETPETPVSSSIYYGSEPKRTYN